MINSASKGLKYKLSSVFCDLFRGGYDGSENTNDKRGI
jgi:hypothetical protein